MKRSALLVTSDGRVLPDTDAFFATLGRLVPGSDPIGFAVRDLGFVKFHQGDDAVTTIEFDPRTARSPPAAPPRSSAVGRIASARCVLCAKPPSFYHRQEEWAQGTNSGDTTWPPKTS